MRGSDKQNNDLSQKSLLRITYYTINTMLFLTYPLVILSGKITKTISPEKQEDSTSREEIAALANIGANEGVFSEKENKMIQNILKLQKIKVTKIMTPRVVVMSINENTTLKEFQKEKKLLTFSRIPIFSEDSEKINGYIFLQDILEELTIDKNSNRQVKEFKRDILIVPYNKTLFNLWDELLEKKEHIAIVVDEYGGLDGIVTMEDIIETLLGLEITDENDTVIDMQKYAKEKWAKNKSKKSVKNL